MFSNYKDKIDAVYAYIKTDFKIEDDEELNKYIGIDLGHIPDASIHILNLFLAQWIINLIPGMDKASFKPTPVVKPLIEKKMDINHKK